MHVPQEALIRGGAVNRVVLALDEGRFRSQPVKVGIEAGDRVEIRSGLNAGDRIVTSGQFLIDSESNIETALARLGTPEDDRPAKVDHSGHAEPADTAPMDHSQHGMEAMDHSEHSKDAMDHSEHENDSAGVEESRKEPL